jgi:hypothetical protein
MFKCYKVKSVKAYVTLQTTASVRCIVSRVFEGGYSPALDRGPSVRFQANFGVFGGQHGTRTGSSPHTSFSLVTVTVAMLHSHIHSSTIDAV